MDLVSTEFIFTMLLRKQLECEKSRFYQVKIKKNNVKSQDYQVLFEKMIDSISNKGNFLLFFFIHSSYI